jgi:nicotinate phosphoribosyltransferase
MCGDVLTVEGDAQEGEALLKPVMRAGRRLEPSIPLAQIRDRTRQQLARIPEPLRSLEPGLEYPVRVSEALQALARAVDERQTRAAGATSE